MTDKIVKEYRRLGKTVGVIAIDPTSPFSGGAILGDRIRMNELTLDEGVFIRSMGTRGSLGGLSHKTADAVKIMDAAGKDVIIVASVSCIYSLGDPMEYERVKDVYRLEASMLGKVKENMKILHPLPRVTEIDQDVDDTPYAYYFKQAENGLYVRMAIISYLLGYR